MPPKINSFRHTGGKHALNEVLHITQDEPITFWCAFILGPKGLDLDDLADWNGEVSRKGIWVVEDGAGVVRS